MRRGTALSIVILTVLASGAPAQTPQLTRDQVYFSIARRVNAQSESPVTNIVGALDEVIEVGEITVSPEGKATVVVKERAPSTSSTTSKTIRLVMVPAGDKWAWESFEENRKLYPVEKLFPYAKDELGRRRQVVAAKWAAYLETMTKQGDSAIRVLETAKAVLQGDPPPMAAVSNARTALAEARKGQDEQAILAAHRDLAQAAQPVGTLTESFEVLKANDAFLRLQEEFKAAQTGVESARKDYLAAVAAYNEGLQRLPFALVAYGMEFTKLEPKIESE